MLPFEPHSRFMIPREGFKPAVMVDSLGVGWTISAELWVGIILFPVYSFLLNKCKILLFPILLFGIVYIMLIANHAPGNRGLDLHHFLYSPFIDYSILRCILDYSIGAYILAVHRQTAPKDCILSVGQIACIIIFCIGYLHFGYKHNNELLAPFLFAAFIILLSFKGGIIYRLTANKLGEFFGDISYPAYLIHPLWVNLSIIFKLNVHNGLIIILYLLLVVISAYLLHRFVERPCLKLLKRPSLAKSGGAL